MWKYKLKNLVEKIAITIIIIMVISGPGAYIWMLDHGYEKKHIGYATIVAILIMLAYLLMIRSSDELEKDRQAEKEELEKQNKLKQ